MEKWDVSGYSELIKIPIDCRQNHNQMIANAFADIVDWQITFDSALDADPHYWDILNVNMSSGTTGYEENHDGRIQCILNVELPSLTVSSAFKSPLVPTSRHPHTGLFVDPISNLTTHTIMSKNKP